MQMILTVLPHIEVVRGLTPCAVLSAFDTNIHWFISNAGNHGLPWSRWSTWATRSWTWMVRWWLGRFSQIMGQTYKTLLDADEYAELVQA